MRRWVAVAVLVLAVVAGCGDAGQRASDPSGAPSSPAVLPPTVSASAAEAEPPGPGDRNVIIFVGGVRRTFLLHAPPGYTGATPLPVVIALHYYPGSGAAMRGLTGLDAKADQNSFLVAYPDGLDRGFNAMVCCGTSNDVAFLTSITRHLVERWRADPDRVYLTGMSNGADMSVRGAIEASGTFAAIGVVSGGYAGPRAEPASNVPTSPVSVVTIIGRKDQEFTTFETGMTKWRERLRCTPSDAPAPAPPVTRTVSRCADGSDVDVYVVPEMGHIWPSGEPSAPLKATDIVWDFFSKHPRQH